MFRKKHIWIWKHWLRSFALEKSVFILFECTRVVILCKIFSPHDFLNWRRTKNMLWLMSNNDILSLWSLIIVVGIFKDKINFWNLLFMLLLENYSKIWHIAPDLRLDDLAWSSSHKVIIMNTWLCILNKYYYTCIIYIKVYNTSRITTNLSP